MKTPFFLLKRDVLNGKSDTGRDPEEDQEKDIQQWQRATWSRKARDRQQWRNLAEGYFQQWKDVA